MSEKEEQPFSDIQNKILDLLPPMCRPYAKLARLDRPIGIWLLLLPALWAVFMASGGFFSMAPHDWGIIFLFFIGSIVMRSAGCIINDLWDIQFDKAVERTQDRPLASGELGKKQAFAFLLGLLFIGAYILFQLPIMSIMLGILAFLLIVTYPYMKRITYWPQAFLGLTFNMSVLIGWSSVGASISMAAIALYFAAFFWTMAYDTIYAYQDKEEDAKIGIKSTALKFEKNAKRWVSAFFVACLILLLLAGVIHGVSYLYYPLLGLPAWHFYTQIIEWDIENKDSSLNTFKSNKMAGVYILILCLLS